MIEVKASKSPEGVRPAFREFAIAVAEDLRSFALLHDREPTSEIIEALRSSPFQEQLSILLQGPDVAAALFLFDDSLAALPKPLDQSTIDELSAEYANIYLRYSYRASPTESVWFDDEALERQQAMFSVRQWYQRYGLKAADWSRRPDDHIVLELEFLAHLFQQAKSTEDLKAAASFLDEHLLTWCGLFAGQLKEGGAAHFFCELAQVNALYLEELRDHLTDLTGVARKRSNKTPSLSKRSAEECEEVQYVPGTGPGW